MSTTSLGFLSETMVFLLNLSIEKKSGEYRERVEELVKNA